MDSSSFAVEGQLTLPPGRASNHTSYKNFFNLLYHFIIPKIARPFRLILTLLPVPLTWQARRESNPEPPDLESGALPVRATGLIYFFNKF